MKSLAIGLKKQYKYQFKMKLRVHNFEMNNVIQRLKKKIKELTELNRRPLKTIQRY